MKTLRGALFGSLLAGLVACGSSSGEGGSESTSGSGGTNDTTGVSVTLGTVGSGISESATASSGETSTTEATSSTSGTTTTSTTESTGGTEGTGGTSSAGSTGGTGGMTELGPGSLAFIGVNSDLPEGFALVALVDVPSGTALRFTERAWNEDTMAFEVMEGTATLTLSTALSAGTVFEVGVTGQTTLTVTPNIGSISSDGTGNWGIAGNGDNLFAYLGSDDDPTFISGIAFSAPTVWTNSSAGLDGQSSMIPSSLSEAAGTITTFSADNLQYTGPRTGEGSLSAYLPLIADEMNYDTGTAAYTPLAGTDFSP